MNAAVPAEQPKKRASDATGAPKAKRPRVVPPKEVASSSSSSSNRPSSSSSSSSSSSLPPSAHAAAPARGSARAPAKAPAKPGTTPRTKPTKPSTKPSPNSGAVDKEAERPPVRVTTDGFFVLEMPEDLLHSLHHAQVTLTPDCSVEEVVASDGTPLHACEASLGQNTVIVDSKGVSPVAPHVLRVLKKPGTSARSSRPSLQKPSYGALMW